MNYSNAPVILRVSILLILSHFYSSVSAQYNLLGIEEGLSHPWAKTITVDQSGNLWVGTIDGLNRYNGSSIRVFRSSGLDGNSISDNYIESVCTDQDNVIWIGTNSGGLSKYLPKKDSFVTYQNQPMQAGTLPSDNITAVFIDSQNRVYVGTRRGLSLFNRQTEKFDRNPFGVEINEQVTSLVEDKQGNIWVGTVNSLYVLAPGIGLINEFNADNSALPTRSILSIYADQESRIWLSLQGGGVYFKEVSGLFEPLYFDNKALEKVNILAINGNQNGKVFFGTEGEGLYSYNLDTKIISREKSKGQSIHSMFMDKERDILWLGSYHHGIESLSEWQKNFIHLQAPLLTNNIVLSMAQSGDKIIVGTDGAGVSIIENNQLVDRINMDNSDLESDVILSIYADEEEEWFGTFLGGLYRRPTQAGKDQMVVFKHNPDNPNTLRNNSVSALYKDDMGIVWIGTMLGGLSRYNRVTNSFVSFVHDDNDVTSISNNFVRQIIAYDEDQLLVVTGTGVDLFNKETGVFSPFSTLDQLISAPLCLLKDSKNNLWIGTRNGIYHQSADNSQAHWITTQDGLPSNTISALLEDDQNNLWVSTQRGLAKLVNATGERSNIELQVFSKEDGLQGLDFKALSAFKDSKGRLYFGGKNGLNYFTPSEIKLNPVKPEVQFAGFELFNEEVNFKNSSILDQPIEYISSIRLKHDENMFTIRFTSSNFILPSKNSFAFMLEGFDKNWIYSGGQNFARYTNVPPGDYTFMVKSGNNDGLWNDEPATLKIAIVPPWWQYQWVQMGFVALLVFAVILAFLLRGRYFRQRQKYLKEQIDEATDQVKHVNEKLEKKNYDLIHKNDLLLEQNHALEQKSAKIHDLVDEIQETNEKKLKFFTNISHELRTPITLILSPLKELMTRASEETTPTYQLMLDNTNRLLKIVNQLLDFREIDTGRADLQVSRTEIIEFTREIFKSFEFLAKRRNILYEFGTNTEKLHGWIDKDKIEKVIMNLLSNAFKFTDEQGHILLEVMANGEELTLTIKDTGKGISSEEINKIFDLYYHSSNASSEQFSSGIGLALIKQYVQLHHGVIKVESSLGQGTSFTINLSLKQSDYTKDEISHEEETSEVIAGEGPVLQELDRPLDRKHSLLIVEDNNDIRAYIKSAFMHDFKVHEAVNGQEGLEQIIKILPDLVISDIMMPVMSGTEFCQQAKSKPETAHIPIILLTAYSGEEIERDGYISGADDYVVKPFDLSILKQKVQNILRTQDLLVQRFKGHQKVDISGLEFPAEDQGFLQRAIELVVNNIDNSNFGVEQLSEMLAVSRRSLLRKIKMYAGLSVNEFIRNVRLKRAAELLSLGNYNINEVAYKIGFSDPKYFSKCFKQDFGLSPSEYVKTLPVEGAK